MDGATSLTCQVAEIGALFDALRGLGGQGEALTSLLPSSRDLARRQAASRTSRRLPALRWLDDAIAAAPAVLRDALADWGRRAGDLEWRQTYARTEASEDFLDRYGWCELVGPGGICRDAHISIGLLLLGPDCHYPPHSHPAVEHYVPLSGAAEWFDADRGWRDVAPLTPILHRAEVVHAMRTSDRPLLALFHWSGQGIGQRARMRE